MDAVLFAAIFPPPAALAEIRAVQDELRARLAGRITWVAPERLHVTVFFLGREGVHGEDEIRGWVRWAIDAVGAGAFDCELCGLRVLRQRDGDGHRAIVLDGGACKPLVDLAGRLNARANRPPHLTLGRTRERLELPARAAPPVGFRAERLVLVRSVPEGPDRGYHVLAEWELPAGAAPWRGWGA